MNIPEGYVLVPSSPDDEIIRRMLAVRWPATYRSCLRFDGSGPETAARTEHDICEATKQYIAAISTASIKLTYDEAKERELFEALTEKECPGADLRRCGKEEESYMNFYVAERWIGWKSCAKSRARSA